ncbi:MAG: SusD/RagB family nutrient-binding outer membrane lipoprotein [Tunicatimonas sp.]|uniref:SusD/RagB family nutrient-binding outer membrane lipoprotein n=1 Tax=Tunicatimonas sp. TaxID=1940096 RepID=UPI003C75B2A9
MKLLYKLFTVSTMSMALLLTTSCGEDFLDINDNPNEPVNPSIDLLFPSAQVAYSTVIVHTTRLGEVGPIAQIYESTDSQYELGGALFNNAWDNLFTLGLVNLDQVITSAPEADLPAHAAIAKLQKAYIYSILIDMWGAAPFDEAVNTEFNEPTWEEGAVVYPKVISLIDEALGELSVLPEDVPTPSSDLIYDGDVDKWIKMGNSLKLRMLINLANGGDASAVGQIESLASNGNLIDSNSDNFEFQYGSTLAPENRHRWHQNHYFATKTYYMSNSLMARMLNNTGGFGSVDPRTRYYFYRQILDFDPTADGAKVVRDDFPCFGYGARFNDETTWQSTCAYGYQGNGYVGRDHGDGTGIPNDDGARTTFGVYPAGGLFDNDSGLSVGQSDGTGAGIVPMITNSMVKFWLAEAALFYGANSGDPRDLLQQAMEAHIAEVQAFPGRAGVSADAAFVPSADDVAAYVNNTLAIYDAAPDNTEPTTLLGSKQDVWAAQFQISLFGNPVEAYNLMRRTKLPLALTADNANASMSIIPTNPYPKRLPFPQDEINTNPNAFRQSDVPWQTSPVFWDTKAYPRRFDGNN